MAATGFRCRGIPAGSVHRDRAGLSPRAGNPSATCHQIRCPPKTVTRSAADHLVTAERVVKGCGSPASAGGTVEFIMEWGSRDVGFVQLLHLDLDLGEVDSP